MWVDEKEEQNMKRRFWKMSVASGLMVLLISGIGQAASFDLVGGYLKVGVNSSGSLINETTMTGIQYDPTGTGTFGAAPPAVDFIAPGTPWEFYSIGVNGTWAAAGYGLDNPFAVTTTNTSSGGLLSASSVGSYQGLLIRSQFTYFPSSSKEIFFSVDLLNPTDKAMDVRYARGLDPDQDVYPGGSYPTNNSIGAGSVTGAGLLTKLAISIIDIGGGGIPSISGSSPDGPWETNPYVLINGGLVNGAVAGNPFDYSINMAWKNTLPAHTSWEIDFKYTISAVPEPSVLLLLGMGLLGIGILGRKR
jgi:hypothetical protein